MTATGVSQNAQRTDGALVGAALCLLSAAGFGAMAIFGKLAYDAGVAPLTLLLTRFALGTVIFGAILVLRRERVAGAGRRALGTGLALGAVGYAIQAGLYFAALRELDASLLALVLYSYPAWVTLAAFVLGRDRPTARRLAALGLSSAGLIIVLAGAATGSFDPLGTALAVGSSLAYTVYILVADRAGVVLAPLVLSALVCLGATMTFATLGAVTGALDWGFRGEGWLWLVAIAVVSTGLPIVAFFAGMARVGPSAAAILSTFEPVVTVTLAYLAFSETLTVVQLAGGVLVLAAALLLARAPSGAAVEHPG